MEEKSGPLRRDRGQLGAAKRTRCKTDLQHGASQPLPSERRGEQDIVELIEPKQYDFHVGDLSASAAAAVELDERQPAPRPNRGVTSCPSSLCRRAASIAQAIHSKLQMLFLSSDALAWCFASMLRICAVTNEL